MEIKYSQGDALSLLYDKVPRSLISDTGYNSLTDLCRQMPLPLSTVLMFETRLDDVETEEIDLSMDIQEPKQPYIREINMAAWQKELEPDVYRYLSHLLEAWQNKDTLLNKFIDTTWFEFDHQSCFNGMPGILYFGLKNIDELTGNNIVPFLNDLTFQWNDAPLRKELLPNLMKCFQNTSPSVKFESMGLPLQREKKVLRFCFRIWDTESLFSFLAAIGLRDKIPRIEQLVKDLFSFVDTMTLLLDIDENISPDFGVEFHVTHKFKLENQIKYAPLLDRLKQSGFCCETKYKALKNWAEEFSLPDAPELSGYLIRKIIYHFKAVFKENSDPFLKGYYAFLLLNRKQKE